MGYKHRHCRKPDIVLRSDPETLEPALEGAPLPVLLKKRKYTLFSEGSLLEVKKCHRQLKVKGSVTNGKFFVTIQKGEEEPRVFEFENSDFSLVEKVKKGDKIFLGYEGTGTVVDMKAKVVKY